MNRKSLYWICNAGGWLLYVLLYAFLNVSRGVSSENFWLQFVIFFFGLFFSHLYRFIIVRFHWLKKEVFYLVPRLILVCLVFSLVLGLITVYTQLYLHLLRTGLRPESITIGTEVYISTIMSFLVIFLLWTLIYFAFHYFLNYKNAEIENLKWQASITEIELNKLKSQLNPHFVFNCMNSIRALVDENPAKAKEAVTQLSSILRNTLMMGRNRLVPFGEELKVVEDYLGLESIRLEERLRVQTTIAPECFTFEVPPLMLQTLVENAIKHGISRLTDGGELLLNAQVTDGNLCVEIRNSGQYKGNTESETGFGIRNTLQRLALLYGDRATFMIRNENAQNVITQLILPKP